MPTTVSEQQSICRALFVHVLLSSRCRSVDEVYRKVEAQTGLDREALTRMLWGPRQAGRDGL